MSKIKRILQAFKRLAGLMRPGIVSGSLAVGLTGIAPGIASAAIRVQTVHRARLAGSVQIASYQAGRRAAGSPPDGKFYHLWPMPY